ncbi:hypothetical protein Tco_0933256 [Tanacetum coccineum]
MVAYLERPTDSDDFTEIVDFLNANPIRYALTVNPTIYVSCIEQFWSTAKAQTINEETQIHALCLSPKKTAWNEFSSNIDYAIICLATNQKFNFSKMIFDGMTRNLDSLSAKILMYRRFLQVFLDKQLDKVPSHNAVYNAHCHTKKVFANMKRIGKDFSGKVTPLFDTMLIQHQSEVGDSLERAATTTSSLEAEQGASSSSDPRRQDTMGDTIARTRFENVSKISYDSPLGGVNIPRSDEDRDYKPEKEGQEARTKRKVKNSRVEKGRNIAEIDADVDISLVHEDAGIQERFDDEDITADLVTTTGEVVTTASVDISTTSVPITVSTATPTTPPTITTKDDMTLAETLMEIKSAKPKAIGVVMQEPSEIPRISAAQQQIQEKAQVSRDKAQFKQKMEEEDRHEDKEKKKINIVSWVISSYDEADIKCSETRVEESSKRVGEETEQAELKEYFKIIPFDEDAVNTIPLATKQAPIIDYKITRDTRKIYYHITRADGSDEMWREQGRYLIKSWKLIDSCGVHCLMLESMYIYMLVEKEYPLAQFTYRRMWEGKLQVDYECEMAFELLRNRPEGCIAEETIAEETIEFFSEYHKSIRTIGIPPNKHETYENKEGNPLSAGKSSEVSAELFQKAHLYVIHNTDELVPYIERHKQVLKTENPGKRIAFLKNEHSKSFAKWLRKEVERELAISKESVSETVSTSGEIDYDSPEPPKSLLKWYHYFSDEYKDNGSSDNSKGVSNKGPSITSIPKEGPSTAKLSKDPIPKELLAWYGYDIVEDYLLVAEKPIPKVIFKSHIPIKRYVLGLANVETWDNIVKKYGMRTPGRCADKSKGKRKDVTTNVTTWDEIEKKMGLADLAYAHCICTLHLQIAYAHCICTLHLKQAFASKHLHIAFAG